MKKILFMSAVLGLATLSFGGCATSSNNGNRAVLNTNTNTVKTNSTVNTTVNSNVSSNANKTVSSADQEFLDKALQGGMKEVQMSGIATEKGQSAEVKAFAQKMINEHSRANNDLRDLAKRIGATPIGGTSVEQQKEMDELRKLSDAAFDKQYVKAMVADHEKDVAVFQKQSQGGANTDLKKFATETLPTLKMHLQMVKELQAKLK